MFFVTNLFFFNFRLTRSRRTKQAKPSGLPPKEIPFLKSEKIKEERTLMFFSFEMSRFQGNGLCSFVSRQALTD